MKSIVTSLGMIVFVAAIVVGGTGAFFSDTETSTGNVFTAGAIDLKVDSVAHVNGLVCYSDEWVPESQVVWNGTALVLADGIDGEDVDSAIVNYNAEFPSNVPHAGDVCAGTWRLTDLEGEVAYRFFDYGDLKPGDNGENTISLHVLNNDAYMCATVSNVATNDNGLTDPEGDVDTTGGVGEGELQNELELVIWEDDGDNVLEGGEQILTQTNNANGITGTYPLFTPENGAILASTTAYLGVYWCYGDLTVASTTLTCNGAPVTNMSQTDSLSADISFYVEQARHNDDFTCNPEVAPVVTTLTLAKTVIPAEFAADALFTLTATGSSTITGIEGAGTVTNAVVLPGTYDLSESGGPGGALVNWQCSVAMDDANTVTITAGQSVVCTVTNNYNQQT